MSREIDSHPDRIDHNVSIPFATTPLLDPANVGRKVWHQSYGRAHTGIITKVTKQTVTVGEGRSAERYRPDDPTGGHATNPPSAQFGSSCFTESWRLEQAERRSLIALITERLRGCGLPGSPVTIDDLRLASRAVSPHAVRPMHVPTS